MSIANPNFHEHYPVQVAGSVHRMSDNVAVQGAQRSDYPLSSVCEVCDAVIYLSCGSADWSDDRRVLPVGRLTERSRCGIHGLSTATGRCSACDEAR